MSVSSLHTDTVVFLGPSLPLAQARQLLPDAHYLPPCAMGDVYGALQRHRPKVIAIIDGLFERTPAVWHKEILYALSQGVTVIGGGSMGALRAAELAAFGMRGVGHSFAGFASGALEDDDEVAITHLGAEDGYRPMCEPMVNLRYGLALAEQQGLLQAAQVQALVAGMKRLFYPERSWDALYALALTQGMAAAQVQALRQWLDMRQPDRKGEDAAAVLRAVRHCEALSADSAPLRPEFEPTVFWDHLVSYHGGTDGGAQAPSQERLIDYVRLGVPGRAQLLDAALLSVLVRLVCRQLGALDVEDGAAMARFRRERGLNKPAELRAWMQAQGLGAEHCLELARDEARTRQLHRRFQEEVNREIPRLLQRQGRLAELGQAVQAQWQALAAQGIGTPEAQDVESLDTVLQWYASTWGPVHGELPAHILERGFGSPRQFMHELLARYLAAQAQQECAA